MKLMDKSLSLVAIGVIGVLQSVQAAPVYEIENLADLMSEDADAPKGTLPSTLYGYGMGINSNDELVGMSKGKKKLTSADVTNGIINIEDGLTAAEKVTYSVNTPIVGNNFSFKAADNTEDNTDWLPTFESINGSTAPSGTTVVNSVDTVFYGINDASTKVGVMSAPEKTVVYTGTSTTQDFWYYRDYEQRGFIKLKGDTEEIAVLPPYTQYIKGSNIANVGGTSTVSAINTTNLAVGYASTDMSSTAKSQVDNCYAASATIPVDVCIQNLQFPTTSNVRVVQYQTRAFVWQLNEIDKTVSATELPLGLTPPVDSTALYIAQGLDVNAEGSVVGRSHVYRNDDTKNLRLEASYWLKSAAGQYAYSAVPMTDDDSTSIAYSINDNGILVGTYTRYIEGFERNKFFYFDTQSADAKVITPDDFTTGLSDLSSVPTDINNQFQVVGNIETSYTRDGLPRPKAGFLFDKNSGEFSNLNNLLTCESKGFVTSSNDSDGYPIWQRKEVKVTDGSDTDLTYKAALLVVQARSINEAGDIAGTVLVKKPLYKRDASGNLVLVNNQPVFELNGAGSPVTAYTPRMVIVRSSGSDVTADWKKQNNCADSTAVEPNVRKGASTLAWLFAVPVIWWRRRKLTA